MNVTPRQMRALRMAGRGMTDADIAAELGVPRQTVKNLMRRAYVRLGVNSRVGAFIALGWLTVPDVEG